jgi:hypothetical protein
MDDAEEAGRLLDMVQAWARQTFPAPTGGMSGTTCEWCPLCQFMAVLRGERPEVTERVSEAGAAVITAFRSFLEVAARNPSEHDRPRVQRIDVDEV